MKTDSQKQTNRTTTPKYQHIKTILKLSKF